MNNNLCKRYRDKSSKLTWVITVALFSSFYIFRTASYGSFVIIALTLLMLFVLLINKGASVKISFSFFHYYLTLFGLYCILSSMWAINSKDSLTKGLTIFEILLCLSVFYIAHTNGHFDTELLFKAIMWAGFIVIIYSYYKYGVKTVINTLSTGDRLDSVFNNINEIATLCSLTIILIFYFWLEKGSFFGFIFAVPGFLLLVASGSKRAILGLIIGIIVLLILKLISNESLKSKKKVLFISLILLVGSIIISGASFFSSISNRMNSFIAGLFGDGGSDYSTDVRKQLLEFGLEIFKNHPLTGIGVGCPHILVNQVFGDDFYLHNNFLELLAGGGVIAFSLFYSIHIVVLFSIFKNGNINNSINRMIIVILAFLLMSDVSSGTYYSKETYFLLMVCYLHISSISQKKMVCSSDSSLITNALIGDISNEKDCVLTSKC